MSFFKKATKEQSKLRLAIYGPSGGGKTYTALGMAQGIAKKGPGGIFLLDTEHRSASKYADHFEFMTGDLSQDKSIDVLVKAINEAAKNECEVLIIDSLSHAWKELLNEIDQIAQTKFKGNTWAAWSEGTPKQQRLIDSILSFPGHIIATIRSKTEWTMDDNKRPQRVGLAPDQGKGIEYEFDMLMSITPEHKVHIEKDRTGKFQDKIIDKPGAEFGKEVAEWLDSGAKSQKTELLEDLNVLGKKMYGKDEWITKKAELTSFVSKGSVDAPSMLDERQLQYLVAQLKKKIEVQAEKEAEPATSMNQEPEPAESSEEPNGDQQAEQLYGKNGDKPKNGQQSGSTKKEQQPAVQMGADFENDVDDDLPF